MLPKPSHEAEPSCLVEREKVALARAHVPLGRGRVGLSGMNGRRGFCQGNHGRLRFAMLMCSPGRKQTATSLWPFVQAGIAEGVLHDVRVYSVVGKLPGPADAEPEAGTPYPEAYRAKRSYKIIRLQIDPTTPILVVNSLFANMLHTTDEFCWETRPSWLSKSQTERASASLTSKCPRSMCSVSQAPTKPLSARFLPGAFRTVSPSASFNELYWLFLGNLGPYAHVEHIPVFPWR